MRLFGTDGVRGVANADLTPELAFRLGRASALVLAEHAAVATGGPADRSRAIVVGRDTRLSGPMLEAALVAGVASSGFDARVVGVIPTPGVARIVAATTAFAGAMISASHNPIGDNGIKFFAHDGTKLDDAQEDAIESATLREDLPRPTHAEIGTVRAAPELVSLYERSLLEDAPSLASLTVVVDAAYGAAFELAPRIFARLGARVVVMHAEDDGSRINVACGSTDLSTLRARVRDLARAAPGARVVGVAFDGDADRALFVDETGGAIDGDRVMMILARERKRAGKPASDAVVGTVMSNLGLERALAEDGIALVRADVGDRYVLERMRAGGLRFGGEQSGHIIDLDRNTTGDGAMTAIALFGTLARSGARLHDLASRLRTVPQVLVNVRTTRRDVLESDAVRASIQRARERLGGRGRILVRASGTEPLLRVMVEGDDGELVDRLASDVAAAIRAEATVAAVASRP